MKIGEKEIDEIKEIGIKDLDATIKCSKKIIEYVRKREKENSSSKNKSPQEQIRLSDQEKCFRTTLIRTGLFTFCAMGLGKSICQSYEIIKDEEKKFGRKLTDYEIHQIIIDIAKRYRIFSEGYTDSMKIKDD